jgi:hypothetical protein
MCGIRPDRVLLPALALLVGASGLSAQRNAAAQLTAVIPPILKLETVSTGGTPELAHGFQQVRGAVVLRITANCRWRLVAVGSAAAPELGVAAASGSYHTAAEFVTLGEARQLASGGPSAALAVVIDYRWQAGLEPAPISFELLPVD